MNGKLRVARRRGFTLVELMVAVAIIAVLASLATVAYGRQVKRARLNDMRAVMQHIAAQQEVFFGFNGQYAAPAASAWCPAVIGPSAQPFNEAACGTAGLWSQLATRFPGSTYFQYQVLAGTPNAGDDCTPPAGLTFDDPSICGRIDNASHWYVIIARADQDGDGTFAEFVTDSTMDGLVLEGASPLD
jgi:prepilin-type N-terminal cleavage/methylation domain-containing protein